MSGRVAAPPLPAAPWGSQPAGWPEAARTDGTLPRAGRLRSARKRFRPRRLLCFYPHRTCPKERRAFQPKQPPRRAARLSLLALAGFIGLCLLVGASNAAVTAQGITGWYAALAQPPGTPPNWLFGPVWTALYLLLGLAAWLVWRRVDVGAERKRAALRAWGWALAANALWSPAFFGLHRPDLSLLVIALMLGTGVAALRRFRQVRPAGAALMLPYLGWITYAAYLNAGIWWLNRA